MFASYFPGFVKPLVFVPLIIAAFVSERLALITGIFLGFHDMSGYGTAFTGTDIVLSVDNLWCDPCRDGGGSRKTGEKLIWYEVLLFCLSVLLPVTFII